MNKIFLIIQREFLNRVQKKSFLIATIVLPLIFPAIMAVLVYFSIQQKKNATRQTIQYVDESGFFVPDTSKFVFKKLAIDVRAAKEAFQSSDDYGLLYIPKLELSHPNGVTLYTKINPSPNDIGNLEGMLENQIRELKMQKFNVDQKVLDSLKTDVPIENLNVADAGQEKKSNSNILLGVGVAAGILMYMFIFIYGAQIMQGIIEEKTSKVVEVIVSSVRPFQLMMGKIIGLASVGLLQFLIWIVLITTLSSVVLAYFGVQMPQQQMMQEVAQNNPNMQGPESVEILKMLSQIPFGYVIFNFLFYFLGGYLLYGALFAAVGSAVDSPAEAQQFMFPITIPLLISYFGLFTFIMNDPHSTVSVWLSIIPFTSPIAMMGRIAFGVPAWQLALSMVSLILGFMLTTWVAGRIYRVGILMHGTKINYKVMAKWFMMKG
ncbi:ABC transporter permease [Chryseolinea soli]|uniref:ABC transporter permease n=1 Tax=Chryseolinea soli TaxID=2321403 RepID=A0A385SMK4_9BACT|nr:ABC transporter permease [Chryseolinea soli]AYB30238.1 ABC transporter permease [Chryseolinea soli]